jgi:hypothetical protein
MAYKGKLTKWQRMSLFCSGYFNKGSNHDMNNPIDKDHIDFIANKIEKLCEGNQLNSESGNCTIFDVISRLDFKEIEDLVQLVHAEDWEYGNSEERCAELVEKTRNRIGYTKEDVRACL